MAAFSRVTAILKGQAGADLGEGAGGAHPPEVKPSSSYSLLKFVYLAGQ